MTSEDNDQFAHRLDKLKFLRERGADPFAIERCERTHSLSQILSSFDKLEHTEVCVAGRIVSFRPMGKAAFAHLQDQDGKLQVYVKMDTVGAESFALMDGIDIGDFLEVSGRVEKTKTGEVTVFASSFRVLSKALRPVPIGKQKDDHEWYSLEDVEQRYRQRYLDLIVHSDVRKTMLSRSKIISAMREFLDKDGFIEVETPVLQSVAGGAAARPFTTFHRALDHEFHLRISLELYLKRLIIGGFEKVYEMGRVFRNEGLSTRHNPEFTMMELYQAYANLEDMMDLVERLFVFICTRLHGGPTFRYREHIIDVTPPWPRLPLLEGIKQYAAAAPEEFKTLEAAKAAGTRLGLPMEEEHTIGGIVDKIHDRFVQPNLIRPTFITDYPIDISPLAKKRPDDPSLTRRFEAFIGGIEMANAFSEINDPLDQRERFVQQAQMRAGGDEEAHPMDEDFLRALEYGMPPTGGLGIGIDRLIILLADQLSIRDVILFPQMRPENQP